MRTYDLRLYHGPGGARAMVPALADDQGGELITGIRKLVQRVLVRLFTPAGSMPFLPNEGTALLVSLQRARTPADISAAFNFAVGTIARQFALEEADTDPADERFLDASLEAFGLMPGQVSLTILVTSLAGTSRTVLAPILTLPGD